MRSGRLTAICGPMFSGKTTELIRRARLAAQSGLRTLVVKPALDTRYSQGELVSHAGERLAARIVEHADAIDELALAFEAIAIDEAHFFGTHLGPICSRLVEQGKLIIVAGLERDHYGNPFEPFPLLLCEADEVIKLSCPCAVCGEPAIHSQRMVPTTGRIVVGGAESYQPRCRTCFEPATAE